MNTVLRKTLAPLAAVLMLGSGAVVAGPVVIDGTDANDHGSVTGGGTNVSGWLYMESVLDNLGAALRVIVKSGVCPFESSGDLVEFYHLDSVFEFDSGYHLCQVIKSA